MLLSPPRTRRFCVTTGRPVWCVSPHQRPYGDGVLGQLDVHLDQVSLSHGHVLIGEHCFIRAHEAADAVFNLGFWARISLSSSLSCLAISSPLAVTGILVWDLRETGNLFRPWISKNFMSSRWRCKQTICRPKNWKYENNKNMRHTFRIVFF